MRAGKMVLLQRLLWSHARDKVAMEGAVLAPELSLEQLLALATNGQV